MPQIEFRPVNRVRPDCAWLLDHRANVTSQIGQDGILAKIFEVIGPGARCCVEFGAWDGRWLSNTYSLIADRGWRGFLIEGNAGKCAEIRANHPYDRVTAVNAVVGWDGENALDAILTRYQAPAEPDLMCIDVDGNDWHIWWALERHRPRVVMIEFNPTVPNDVHFVQDPDLAVHQGASLLAMIWLGREKGYSLVSANRWDAFFVTDELCPAFGIPDNGIDAMHFYPDMETRLFQGYDGTLLTAGNHRLIWKNVDFTSEEIQVLPRSLRHLGGV
jgi:hypothetical protein